MACMWFISFKEEFQPNCQRGICDTAVRGHYSALRKHIYSKILKILQLKTENFQIKNSDIFHISAQNIDFVDTR